MDALPPHRRPCRKIKHEVQSGVFRRSAAAHGRRLARSLIILDRRALQHDVSQPGKLFNAEDENSHSKPVAAVDHARQRFHLSHAHVQMAFELGLNPKKFGKLANHQQEPWKLALPDFIVKLYFKRYASGRVPAEPAISQGPIIHVHHIAKIDLPVVLGLLAGATTNTPSLAASQQVIADIEFCWNPRSPTHYVRRRVDIGVAIDIITATSTASGIRPKRNRGSHARGG